MARTGPDDKQPQNDDRERQGDVAGEQEARPGSAVLFRREEKNREGLVP